MKTRITTSIAQGLTIPLLALVAGCSSQPAADPAHKGATAQPQPEPAPAVAREGHPPGGLDNGQPSKEALAELLLLGLREKDRELLESLRVTEREYTDLLFPEFPAAGGNAAASFHWMLLQTGSVPGIESALEAYGGVDYELLEVIATKGTQDYRTFRIHSKVELRVRRRSDQSLGQIRVCGSMVERGGQFKVLSYKN